MPNNPKQKVMIVCAVLAALTSIFLIASVAAPDWIVYSSNFDIGTFQGLFRWCKGDVCFSNNFQVTGSSPLLASPLKCGRTGNEVADRFQATAAMIICGVITASIVLLCQLGVYFGLDLSEKFISGVAWLSAVAFLFLLVGVAVFGGTVNSWWNCGSDFCQQFAGTETHCGIGFSFIFCIVAVGILLAVAIVNVMNAKLPHILSPTADIVLMVILLQILGIVLAIVGLTTDHWQEVVIQHKRFGLFQNCTASTCETSSYPLTFTTLPGCNVTGTTLTSRLYASSAFLVIGLSISFVMAVFFVLVHLKISTKFLLTRAMKKKMLAAVVGCICSQVLGLILVTNVTDSFFYCGTSFCEFNRGFCHQGISFGLCVTSIGLTGLMLMLLLFEFNEWCCFQERFVSGRQKFSIMKVLRGTKARGSSSAEPAEEAEEEAAVELPAGQWDYDSLSGFYWSEELYLFYDPVTQQFYDPNKDEWFAQDRRTELAKKASIVVRASPARTQSTVTPSRVASMRR
jgi:hypothetical protein